MKARTREQITDILGEDTGKGEKEKNHQNMIDKGADNGHQID